MKNLKIASAVCAIIGLVMMWIGWDMAHDSFSLFGKHYLYGDYTTFKWGCVILVLAFILFIIPYVGNFKMDSIFDAKKVIYLTIRALAIFSFLCSLAVCAISIRNEFDSFGIGAISCVSSVCMYGFSYIVEAACIYIDNHKPQQEEQDE